MTTTPPPLFDCHGEHVFQFGACIYCDTPEAQQPTATTDPIAYAMADGWLPTAEDPTSYTHRLVVDPDAPFATIVDLDGIEPSDVDRRMSAVTAMLSDRLTSALAEIDDLRAANHAHAIASEDLGRRLELAEAGRGDDLEQRGKFVELQHRFAALASDYRDRGEALGDLQAELNREREARRELIVRTPSDHHHDGPTRNGMAIAELKFRLNERIEPAIEGLDHSLDVLRHRVEQIENKVRTSCRFCREPATTADGLCGNHGEVVDLVELAGAIIIDGAANYDPFVFTLYANANNRVAIPASYFAGLTQSSHVELRIEPR